MQMNHDIKHDITIGDNFPWKQDLTRHANYCLSWKEFAWHVKSRFLGKISKIYKSFFLLFIYLFYSSSKFPPCQAGDSHEVPTPIFLKKKHIISLTLPNKCFLHSFSVNRSKLKSKGHDQTKRLIGQTYWLAYETVAFCYFCFNLIIVLISIDLLDCKIIYYANTEDPDQTTQLRILQSLMLLY